jgi:peptidyl-prolyl cis-trans isomerase SurA
MLMAVASAALIAASAAYAPETHASVIERIVAVVGEQPILLTELRQRARPYLIKIYSNVPAPQQSVAVGEMYKELLGKLVDERVVASAADKLNVTVTTKEVDDAIKLKAADLKASIADLVVEASKQGLSEADYREEVRRELLFGKMLETRVRSRVRPTEDDAKEYYKRIVVQERRNQPFQASIITLDLASGEEGTKKRLLADQLVKAARSGDDFATLAKKHSVDVSRDKGGDLGNQVPGALGKLVDDAALRLDTGEVSEPVVTGSKIVIIKITKREKSQVPAYEEVKDIVLMRVRDEMLQKQIRVWLDELKVGVYIDVRL